MRNKVRLRRSEGGFSVSVPDLPGCWSQGASEGEALENIRLAIEEYLAANAELPGVAPSGRFIRTGRLRDSELGAESVE